MPPPWPHSTSLRCDVQAGSRCVREACMEKRGDGIWSSVAGVCRGPRGAAPLGMSMAPRYAVQNPQADAWAEGVHAQGGDETCGARTGCTRVM